MSSEVLIINQDAVMISRQNSRATLIPKPKDTGWIRTHVIESKSGKTIEQVVRLPPFGYGIRAVKRAGKRVRFYTEDLKPWRDEDGCRMFPRKGYDSFADALVWTKETIAWVRGLQNALKKIGLVPAKDVSKEASNGC